MNSILEQEKKWLLDEKHQGIVTETYTKECVLLEQGVPVAYLIGNIPFLGAHIDLSEKPLIPRPETELWTKEVLDSLPADTPIDILDIFAGSGCIGLGILHNTENTHVVFAEKNKNYIKQIKKNIELNKIDQERVTILESDVFSSIFDQKFDYILANPPYISENKKDTVQDSVLTNEDPAALFAGDDGLFFVKKLIDESEQYLKLGGKLYIEYDPWQTDLICEYLEFKEISNYSIWKDQYKKNRVVITSY